MNRLNAMGHRLWGMAMKFEFDHKLQEMFMEGAVEVQRISWATRKPAREIGGLEFI